MRVISRAKKIAYRLMQTIRSQWVYSPKTRNEVNHAQLIGDVARFLGLEQATVEDMFRQYREFHIAKEYATNLGEQKTLTFEEAFIIFVCLNYGISRSLPIESIVEIGTQYGKSTRRIIDMKDKLGLDAKIVCFDIEDEVQFFSPNEATLILEDVSEKVHETVIEPYTPGLIFLDARPYRLIENVVRAVLDTSNCILVIHDCSVGLYNPKMKINKDSVEITSETGIWERYALADVFEIKNPGSRKLDQCETDSHRLNIFETQHGLAVILPKNHEALA